VVLKEQFVVEVISVSMKYLIFGAQGQLGQQLSNVLIDKNVDFQSYSRNQIDILDFQDVRAIVKEKRPEVILNAAAWTNVREAEIHLNAAYKVNSDAVSNLAECSLEFGSRLIHFSTDYVFNGESRTPFKEEDSKGPLNFYGYSKLAGECAIVNSTLKNFFVFRTAWLYGPVGKNFLTSMLRLALKTKQNVNVVNDQSGQPTSVTELAKSAIDASERNLPSGFYNLTNSGEASWYEFAREIFSLAGEDVNRVIPVSTLDYKDSVKRPGFSVMSNSKWIRSGMEPLNDWRHSLAKVIPGAIRNLEIEKNGNH